MKIINAVKNAIDIAAVLIQAPYMIVGGFIIEALRKDYESSHNLYVWAPMTGIIVYWIDWLGRPDYWVIPYSKLFKKH